MKVCKTGFLKQIDYVRGQQGFTLVEAMIVVALLGILAAIAMPSYQSHIQKTHRKDAEVALMQFRQTMERFYGNRFTYVGAAADGAATGVPAIFPASTPVDRSAADGARTYYNLAIVEATAAEFWLSATPVGSQVGDQCGTLYLHSSGLRGSAEASASTPCWNGSENNLPGDE